MPKEELNFFTTLKSIETSTRKIGCIGHAFDLLEQNQGRGSVYYVWIPDAKLEKVFYGHAYYLPDTNNTNDFALNQADNGFEGYPQLTVEEVMSRGIKLSSRSAVEIKTIMNIYTVLVCQQIDISFYLKY